LPNTALDKELGGCLELIGESRRVGVVWPGNVNDHSLPRACKQNSVSINSILVFLRILVRLPGLSVEVATEPFRSAPEKIFIPAKTDPVQFQSLNLKLRGRDLEL